MMNATPNNVREIFIAALKLEPDQWPTYLSEACGPDGELRERVQKLLLAHQQAGTFLQPVAGGLIAEVDHPAMDRPGTVIGPYKLLQQIGEGGMGTVFMAEQEQPVRRKVALKIIKPGMDSRQVVARFEAERQALALMDHQNIARVHDAGATDRGRPYFVMELVYGVPLTKYCDDNHLTIRERLELFVPVCKAIQHAHQKGIIHRDLKPSNILVCHYDDKPVPKIIDFGVAKAIEQRLTDKTMFTQYGQIIGTFEYMSPEQAEMSQLGVDTRSDIYSLGVMLYELLTGLTPFEGLREAGLSEMLRTIKEQEPPRPSTRLSSTQEAAQIASARRTEPAKLAKLVRGELDWIVMKCLEKDRSRRYETANGLARDVQRYLTGETVEACPPSTVYRLRKFAHKYRGGLLIAALFVLLLLAGVALSTWQAIRARSAEEKTRLALDESREAKAKLEKALAESREARGQAETVSQYLVKVFRTPDPRQDGWNVKVADVLERAPADLDTSFAHAPKTKAELLYALGRTYDGLRLFNKAAEMFEKTHALRQATLPPNHAETLRTARDLAAAYRGAGRPDDAIALAKQTHRLQTNRLGADHRDTLSTAAVLGDSYRTAQRFDEAIEILDPSLKLCKSKLGTGDDVTLKTMNDLALTYRDAGRLAQAVSLFEETVRAMTAALGQEGLDTLVASNNLGDTYRMAGQYTDAVRLLESILKPCHTRLGAENPTTLEVMNNLGLAYKEAERLREAESLLKKTLERMTQKLGPNDRETLNTANNLAEAYMASGRSTLAIALLEQSLPRCRSSLGLENSVTITALYDLALAYQGANEPARAEPLLIEWVHWTRQKHGNDSVQLTRALAFLSLIRLAQEKYTEAEPGLRECLALREKQEPDFWTTFSAKSMLGGALLGQKKYAEAEPLLVAGYEGMKKRAEQIQPRFRQQRLREAAERLVRLYEATGQKDKADEWRNKEEQAKPPAQSAAKP